MYQQHLIVINDAAIQQCRHDITMQSLKDIGIDPSDSACDRLLNFFRLREDISFIAVTHSIDSGYVTMRKGSQDSKCEYNAQSTSECIHDFEIKSWRNTLKVNKGKKILVAVAWVHSSNYRNIQLFPEVLSVDVTFGVCREQRNLLRFCGIDGHLKVFEVMNCFMPSKQFKAFDWAVRVALPKLIGTECLRFNRLITSDQEANLIASIRSLIEENENNEACNFTMHRLDMFHIFIKEWKCKVSEILYYEFAKYSFIKK